MGLLSTVFGIGVVGGSLSGLLGIGGGIITAPLLLYLPGWLGQSHLSMHVVSGLTITPALGAGLVGAVAHGRQHTVDPKLAGTMGTVIFFASLAGAAGSRYFTHGFLLGVFALLAFFAAGLVFLPGVAGSRADYVFGDFSPARAAAVAAGIGLLGGLVGQGGSFLLIPAMVAWLEVPLRVAMGSNLVIVFCASLAGFIGKAVTGQVSAGLALALLAGIVPGSLLGSHLSRRIPVRALRFVLGGVIVVACVRMMLDLAG